MTQSKIPTATYGSILRDWRRIRRISQLALGLTAEVSPRHVSFLESGRAKPSRKMVLKLADRLEMPKAEINRALLCAGFAPAYQARKLDHTELAPVHAAIGNLLENHLPYPALALDHLWNITNANEAAMRFLAHTGFGGSTNVLTALATQPPEESTIVNWEEVIDLLLTRLRAETPPAGEDSGLAKLVQDLHDHFNRYETGLIVDRTQAIIPTRFKIGERVISLFSTIAQFGTVQDLTVDDLKVELMFPMDEQSQCYFKNGADRP